jgi:thioredoxin 1
MPRLVVAKPIVLAFALLGLAACSGGAQEPAAPAPAASGKPRLVFFMNPNGGPCQAQDRILREMSAELFGKAEVVYLQTTQPADLPRFSEYGIRALPQLLVTDANGREVRRATPGIQGPDQVRQLLSGS